MGVEDKSILLYIPGWRSGVGIVDDESQEIDSQESKGKAEEGFFVLVKEIAGEGQGQGHPAQIE